MYGRLDSPPKKRPHSHFPSSSSLGQIVEHVAAGQRTAAPPPQNRRGRHTGGEIVEVQGGHIVRATGRKDRHSKVCTAKGPRDRRVRLSAHTAIQFYDVQDRLGYDRPSKAVDWLMKKAKEAIDELDELPPWNPTPGPVLNQNPDEKPQEVPPPEIYNSLAGSSFLPPSMDSDSIADTIKSFFPIGASSESSNSAQDLRLSLQSLQDPVYLHRQQPPQHHHQTEHGIFPTGYEAPAAIWPETQSDLSRFQRTPPWNHGGDAVVGGGGFVFNSPPLFGGGNCQLFSQQRGPLQSSNNTQSIRAWMDQPSIATASNSEHHHHQSFPFHPQPLSGIGFGAFGGFAGFHIPARIQGEDEEHDGVSDKPSSASSDSRH